MLAPLFDRMVEQDIHLRFTASQSLQFFSDQIFNHLTAEQLNTPPPLTFALDYESIDLWVNLPDTFVRTWSVFRRQRPSLVTRVIRSLCTTEGGYLAVQSARKVGRSVRLLHRYVKSD